MTVTRSATGVPFVIGGPESAFRVAPVTAHGSLFRGTMETGTGSSGLTERPLSDRWASWSTTSWGIPS